MRSLLSAIPAVFPIEKFYQVEAHADGVIIRRSRRTFQIALPPVVPMQNPVPAAPGIIREILPSVTPDPLMP